MDDGAPRFGDRDDAGRQLGHRIAGLHLPDVVVLGLPRGGVPVAAAVADVLHAPLDVIIVRKLGLPLNLEVAMGAVAEGNVTIADDHAIARARVTEDEYARVVARERTTVRTRLAHLRGGRHLNLDGKTALIVDDGIATGATATAACLVARQSGAETVVLAVPVASPRALPQIRGADRIVCLREPPDFEAVGQYYDRFGQTSDTEVERLLRRARRRSDATTWTRTQPASPPTSPV